ETWIPTSDLGLSEARALSPAGQVVFQKSHHPVHDDAFDRQRDEAGEDQWNLELRLQHQIADAVVRGDAFGDDRTNERQCYGDLQGTEEIGQRAWNADLTHDVQLRGPSPLSTSSSSGSMVARPVATFTTIGKKEIRNAVSTAGTNPIPNHSTRIGTTATFGMALKPIISG